MSETPTEVFDLLIIGGGINGVGIARDAAGRGLRVALCEMDDLANATSSASSKLVHGGLRYLEQFEFRLVREALAEREVLLRIAPHLVTPMRFVIPHVPELRPAWMIRAGLFLYDHLSTRVSLPASTAVDLTTGDYAGVFKPGLKRGFSYSDCWVDDARLVVLNARDAADRGARIFTRTRFKSATSKNAIWRATVEDRRDDSSTELQARVLVNASGPWVTKTLDLVPGAEQRHRMRLIKGSHIVVPRVHPGNFALILQNDDERVIFVIPFEDDYSLIGTTDVAVSGAPGPAAITDDEIDYLCRATNRYLASTCTPDDIQWSYAGVRPLFDGGASKASEISRDYALELDHQGNSAPVLSVYGGKLTTYRKLAQRALDMLAPQFPGAGPAWTSEQVLPGGALPGGGLEALIKELCGNYSNFDRTLIARLARRHGNLADEMLGAASRASGAGAHFGADLHAFEVDYLVRKEWARTADDILWRRTKAGLRLDPAGANALASYLQQRGPGTA